MDVGKAAPQFERIFSIYRHSKELQSRLCEYHIVVVDLCHYLVKFSKKSVLGQLKSSLSDKDLQDYRTQLGLCATAVQEEINTLHVEEAGRANSQLAIFFSEGKQKKKLQARLRILQTLSTFDHELSWRQIRKTGSTSLFERDDNYKVWKQKSDSCTLLYTGHLGCGKSVLLANIVDDLHLGKSKDDGCIAFFFCRHDVGESLKARTIFGSIAMQLLRSTDQVLNMPQLLESGAFVSDIDSIFAIVGANSLPKSRNYLVLDGLDELQAQEMANLMPALRKLQQMCPLCICISSRTEPGRDRRSDFEELISLTVSSFTEENPEIDAYIQNQLEQCVSTGRLALNDPSLILEIRETLRTRSRGMFLWTALQMDALCLAPTDEAIRDALENLPKDLSETYTRNLQRSSEKAGTYRNKIIELMLAALRPLTFEELQEAVSVECGNTSWNPAKLVHDDTMIAATSGGLLFIDEEEHTFHLVHHSFKQFLLEDSTGRHECIATLDAAQMAMATTIVTYMNYGVFNTALTTTPRRPQVQTSQAAEMIIQSVLPGSSKAQMALDLLRSSKISSFDINRVLAQARESSKTIVSHKHPFYEYAKVNFADHVVHIKKDENSAIWELMFQTLRNPNSIGHAESVTQRQRTFLRALAVKNEELASTMLSDPETGFDIDCKNEVGHSALELAVQYGLLKICRTLIDRRNETSSQLDGKALLWLAVKNGHHQIIPHLSRLRGKSITQNKIETPSSSPIVWAAEYESSEVVEALLMGWTHWNTASKYQKFELVEVAMAKAALRDDLKVAKLLRKSSAWIHDYRDEKNHNVMFRAAHRGDSAMVRVLHDLNDESTYCRENNDDDATPFLAAVRAGHSNVVRTFLEHQQHVSTNAELQKAMQLAKDSSHESVVQVLEWWPAEKVRREEEKRIQDEQQKAERARQANIEGCFCCSICLLFVVMVFFILAMIFADAITVIREIIKFIAP